MKALFGLVLCSIIAGCASTPDNRGAPLATQARPGDLCLRSVIDYSILEEGSGFALMPGRYAFAKIDDEAVRYEPSVSQVRGIGKDHVRYIEAFWYSENNADVCIKTNVREICVNVGGIQACDS